MKRALCITFDGLPPRPRPLREDELKAVFGGCAGSNGNCVVDSDCCNNLCFTSDTGANCF